MAVLYGGIDPGKAGGFSFIDKETQEAVSFPWDDQAFVSYLANIKDGGDSVALVCVEKVAAMPKNGAVSMFHFGQSFGFIIGVLTALKIPFQLVPPKTWKKEYSLDNDKQKSIEACQRLFPSVSLIPKGCRKPQDGMAESLLMADYAKRKYSF